MDCKRQLRAYAALLCGVFFCCLPLMVMARGLTISPVMIELDSARKVETITLTNNGDTKVTFQSRVLVWQQVEGADRFTPTDAVLVSPAIFDIAPKSNQVLRVALRNHDHSSVERTFRLLLEDVSQPDPSAVRPAVALRLTHSLPIFVAPSTKPVADLKWIPCNADGTLDCLRVSNSGNRHIRVHSLTLLGETWQRKLDTPMTVLAGAWREWRFDRIPASTAITSVTLENDRERFVAARSPSGSEVMDVTLANLASTIDPCSPDALKAPVHAQVSIESETRRSDERIVTALQSCPGPSAARDP